MNSTNVTSDSYPDRDLFKKLIIALNVLYFIFLVIGTILNVWLLCAVASSADLRVRMRNKLIISTSVLHLMECYTLIPLSFAFWIRVNFECALPSAYINIDLILDFVSNWILVEMIALYLCQTMDLKTFENLTSLGQRVVTISVLLLPWVTSLITVPAMIHSDRLETLYDCFVPKSYAIFKLCDSLVPLIVSIILLVVATIKKQNRYRGDFSASNMQVELISRGPESDESSAYVMAIAVSILCDTGSIIVLLRLAEYRLLFDFFSSLLETSRAVIMALPWLLLMDIRTRMKTWRPWYRPSAGIDLTVAYGIGQDGQ